MTTHPKGSEWRIWDLHVHTPDSLVHDYTGPLDERWPRFLRELEDLPSDLKVLGINDYWFLDGYRKVRAAKDGGRLQNIDEVFPVVEVRCDTFSGTESNLRRLNVHMILDPAVPVDDLELQLRTVMKASYRLSADSEAADWAEAPSMESMERLGRLIRESTPEDKRAEFEGKSDSEIGFFNLNISFDSVRRGVEENSLLREHVLLALGKVEWDNIRWGIASIAQKKTYVNKASALFTAAKSRDAFHRSLDSLKKAEVRNNLLDCSDAHTWSSSTSHMRLGACFTWMNADPTFKGLRQALQEYDHRVSAQERPPVLTRIAQSPRSVMTSVSIKKGNDSTDADLFDTTIPLNPGFVVVIGNKGQGKSALLDSISLAGNSDRQDDFSFLNLKRFRGPTGKASEYVVSVEWADGTLSEAPLDASFDPGRPARIDYLPQSLIEKVCSADPNSVIKRGFEAEIERVVFRHIDDSTRGSATSLAQYLENEGQDHDAAVRSARVRITDAAAELSDLRHRQIELEALDLSSRQEALRQQIEQIELALTGVSQQIEAGGNDEQAAQAGELRAAREGEQAVVDRIAAIQDEIDALGSKTGEATELLESVQASIASIGEAAAELAELIGVEATSLLELSFEQSLVDSWVQARVDEIRALDQTRTESGGLNEQLAVAQRLVIEKQDVLKSFNEQVQELLQQQTDLRAQAQNLIGEPGDPESLRGIESLQGELTAIPLTIAEAERQLHDAVRDLHTALTAVKNLQRSAYAPATDFVQANELAKTVDLEFDVEFRVRDFADRWSDMVNRQKLGQFQDLGSHDRDEQLLGDVDLDNADELIAVLDRIVDRLGRNAGKIDGSRRPLDAIMRSAHKPADLIGEIYSLEWLHSQYIIRSGGAELSELSPGQRGLVLLLFYLLVDKSERPLLLDQPEENLDNQTVRNILVPALQEAVQRRQVVAVTHNPNFAVVGDADQIIVATFDGAFTYRSGSLAELDIGQSAIDVLEGTREAFASRSVKYTDVVGRA